VTAAVSPAGERHSVHFAVYRWKAGSPVAEIERGFGELCRMGTDVPGIRLVSWGVNDSEFGQGYTHAMTIVGDDMAAVRAYRELARSHPIAEVMHACEEDGIGADYDYASTAGLLLDQDGALGTRVRSRSS
jgi:Stress responsive A/B Barrel Domain